MNELFNDLPDVLDAKALAHALSISKSGAYTLLNQKDFPTLRIGGRKLVTKPISFAG
ncbi:MAG: DNA-binding protein [Christensenellales bacterium]